MYIGELFGHNVIPCKYNAHITSNDKAYMYLDGPLSQPPSCKGTMHLLDVVAVAPCSPNRDNSKNQACKETNQRPWSIYEPQDYKYIAFMPRAPRTVPEERIFFRVEYSWQNVDVRDICSRRMNPSEHAHVDRREDNLP